MNHLEGPTLSENITQRKKSMLLASQPRLWLQIVLVKERRIKELGEIDAETLTHLVNDTQFYRVIEAIHDIVDRRFRQTAFYKKLILCHVALLEQFRNSLAERFVELHLLTLNA